MESLTDPAALRHEELDIPSSLTPFVTRRMRTWSEEPVDFVMPLPPSGSMFMTLVYGDPMTLEFSPGHPEQAPELFIGGQLRDTLPVARVHGHVGVTGFEFTPTGFYRLFHRDCQSFTDTATPMETVLPEAVRSLGNGLAETTDLLEKIAALQSFLMDQVPAARPPSVVDTAVDHLEAASGNLAVSELARVSHLGARQLNRRFLREVGVGPKHLAKVIQLRNAIMTLQSGSTGSLQTLAQSAGYFDQSHFINDFRRLVGTNPLAFLHAGESFLRTYLRHRRG